MQLTSRWPIYTIITLSALLITVVAYANFKVMRFESLTTNNTNELKNGNVCLVLGTAKLLRSGNENQFYSNRMHAAFLAYASGKCAKFIVSGDNRHHDYNEPDMMKDSLSKLGIPTEDIYCDYAGGRTLDSVIRFKMVFGQSSGIVISQQFHNARAIYIGKSHNISLIGLNAEDPTAFSSFKTKFREIFSRTRAFFDVELFNSEPRHYGDKVNI